MENIIPSGIWKTGSGSVLRLKVNDDGRLQGDYGTTHGRPEPEERFPIIGTVNGALISYTVNWGKYHSITSWCGKYDRDKDGRQTIKYIWHLVREYADTEQTRKLQHWESFLTYTGEIFYDRPFNDTDTDLLS